MSEAASEKRRGGPPKLQTGRLTLALPTELLEQVRAGARQQHRTVSEFVRTAIRRELKRRP